MLRPSLIAKKPEATHVKKIADLAASIIEDMDRGQACDDKLLEMAQITGHQEYDRDYFATLHCHSSVKEFAREAALPIAQKVSDITRDELIDIVRRMMKASSDERRYYSTLFDMHVPLAEASGLIDYPQYWKNGQDLSCYNPTAEEIVDIAMAKESVIRL